MVGVSWRVRASVLGHGAIAYYAHDCAGALLLAPCEV